MLFVASKKEIFITLSKFPINLLEIFVDALECILFNNILEILKIYLIEKHDSNAKILITRKRSRSTNG